MTPEALQAEYSRKLQEVRETCRKIDALIEDLLISSGSPNIPEVHNITFDPIGGRDGKAVGPGRTGRHVISGPAGELAGVRERTA